MPYRCAASHCKENDKNGPKVHVFYSKDQALSDI